MEMDGGATRGYWATGRREIASTPNSMIRMETTQAKTGRSMKKRAMVGGPYFLPSEAGGGGGVFAGVAAEAVTGLTVAPGRVFCRPSMMTRSPGLRPSETIQLSPTAVPRVTERNSTLLSGRTTRALAVPPAP